MLIPAGLDLIKLKVALRDRIRHPESGGRADDWGPERCGDRIGAREQRRISVDRATAVVRACRSLRSSLTDAELLSRDHSADKMSSKEGGVGQGEGRAPRARSKMQGARGRPVAAFPQLAAFPGPFI